MSLPPRCCDSQALRKNGGERRVRVGNRSRSAVHGGGLRASVRIRTVLARPRGSRRTPVRGGVEQCSCQCTSPHRGAGNVLSTTGRPRYASAPHSRTPEGSTSEEGFTQRMPESNRPPRVRATLPIPMGASPELPIRPPRVHLPALPCEKNATPLSRRVSSPDFRRCETPGQTPRTAPA